MDSYRFGPPLGDHMLFCEMLWDEPLTGGSLRITARLWVTESRRANPPEESLREKAREEAVRIAKAFLEAHELC